MSHRIRICLGTLLILSPSLLLDSRLAAQKLHLEEIQRLRFAYGVTRSLAFSPDEKFLACGGELGDLTIYDLAHQSKVLDIQVSHTALRQNLFFPDGQRVAVLSQDLSVWSFPEGRLLERWSIGKIVPELSSMTISPDSKWIAYRHDHDILIRESDTSRIAAKVHIGWRRLGGLHFSADGSNLRLGRAFVWNWRKKGSSLSPLPVSKEQARPLPPDKDSKALGSFRIESMFSREVRAPSSSGKLMARASDEHPVRIWHKRGTLPFTMRKERPSVRRPGDPLMILPGNAARPSSLAFTPEGKHLVIGAGMHIVAVDLANGMRHPLGPGKVVAPGWRPSEIIIGQTANGTVFRANAISCERSRLCNVFKGFLDTSPATLVPSPTQVRFLYSTSGVTENHDYYIWNRDDSLLHLDGYPSYRDATWSQDGDVLLVITSLPSCVGLSVPRIRIHSMSKASPWSAAASRAANLIPLPLTGGFSPGTKRVTWGGRQGAVTYTKSEDGQGEIHSNSKASMVWLRYSDEDHFLSHDDRVLSLWQARELKLLATSNPFQAPMNSRRKGPKSKASSQDRFIENEIAIFIHHAILSQDGKRLALVGNRDVRVFNLEIR